MSLLLQDFAVTGIAIAAALVLVRRIGNAVTTTRNSGQCEACPGCSDSVGRGSAANSPERT
jgi:hypothetical protein